MLIPRLLRVLREPALIYLAASTIQRLAAFLLIPVYMRHLSLEDYGNFALSQTATSPLSLMMGAGLCSSVLRFYFDGADSKVGAIRSASVARWISVLCLVSAIVLGGATFAVPGLGPFSRYALALILAQAAGGALSAPTIVYLRSANRAYSVAAFQVADFALTLTLGFVLVAVRGHGWLGALEASALSSSLVGVVACAFLWFRTTGRLDRGLLREATVFSAPLVPHTIASWLLAAADRWTLKSYGFHDTVGSYSVAAQLTTGAAMPSVALAEADFARVGEIFRARGMRGVDGDFFHARKRFLVVAAVPTIILLMVTPLLHFVLHGVAGEVIPLLPALCAIVILDAQFYPGQNVIYCAGKSRSIMFVTAATLATNLGALIVLTPLFGVAGAITAKAAGSLARVLGVALVARSLLKEALNAKPPESV